MGHHLPVLETAWRVRRAGRVAGLILVVFWVALSIGLTVAGYTGGVIAIVWAATGLVMIAVWRSAFVPYIALTETGVVVQNPLLRSTVPYADIASVDPGYYGIAIRRRRGDAVTAWAVQKSNWRRWRHDTTTRADGVAERIRTRAHDVG